jgi:hypothetical protein
MKFGSVILIAFPSNAQINSPKMEKDRETEREKETEKHEIELDKEKPKRLNYFEINCICSSFGEPKF